MSSSTLFVRNKSDEFIGQVIISRPNVPDKLVVVDYTRDNNVFKNTTPGKVFSMKCDHPKFIGFSKYLSDRKKAAVIKLQRASGEKDILFILPPTTPSLLTEVSCLMSSDITQASSITTAPSVEAPKPIPKQTALARPAAAPSSGGSGFLSSLLNKVEADVVSYTKAPLIKAGVLSAVEKLQNRVRDALVALELEDERAGGRTEVAFEPMEPEQRYLVHEVVDEFENLIGKSQGEDIERHVVVYKKGYEPVEQEDPEAAALRLASEAQRVAAAAALKKRLAQEKKSQQLSAGQPPPPANMVKVSGKRDRRTIEDYQNDKKKKLES